MGPIYFLAFIVLAVALCLAGIVFKLQKGNRAVANEIRQACFEKMPDIEEVESLSILPLVDYKTADTRLKTEAGVSYLIRTDDTAMLLDVGLNQKGEHPSPLLCNMRILGVSPEDLDAIFISHLHLDHLGGMAEQKRGEFSLSKGMVNLPEIPVYAPEPLAPSRWNHGPAVSVVTGPRKLAKGIASMGPIPRNLFLMGYTLEQTLAINVKGKGIVIVVGCGHPTIERILDRAAMLFDRPVYAIIGGLHFPVHGGRLMLGPINLQAVVGTDRPPWEPICEQDVDDAIKYIKKADPKVVALSPHDSSDWSIERFRAAFGDRYTDLLVGKEILI
ncbi:MAG: MBL fold metallo-hydrolase [Desulfococcus sp. 4484_241]|nr:MAG: MBL fold metallo-hydrolase [Desulfococcus sp. 4484_241]